MKKRTTLTNILQGDIEQLTTHWNAATAAADLSILPAGRYRCRIVEGSEFLSTRKRTPGYRITFEVCEGEHTGCRFLHVIWLTQHAMPMAKRDLKKLGVKKLNQIQGPLPRGLVAEVEVGQIKGEDGLPINRVRRFDVVKRRARRTRKVTR